MAVDILFGHVPAGLHGVLYRNGPGLFRRNEQRVSHVLDGDGRVDRISFAHMTVSSQSRFVETDHYIVEDDLQRFIFRGVFGSRYHKPNSEVKNPSNTAVIPFGSQSLLSLWEGGLPYELDKETLGTRGVHQYEWAEASRPGNRSLFSSGMSWVDSCFRLGGVGVGAHVTRFGGATTFLTTQVRPHDVRFSFVKTDSATGNLLKKMTIQLPGFTHIHSFAETADFYVLICPKMNFDHYEFLVNGKGVPDALSHANEPSSVVTVHKTTRAVSSYAIAPMYATHFSNAYQKDGVLSLMFAGCSNLDFHNIPEMKLHQILIDTACGFVKQAPRVISIDGALSEFPAINPAFSGRENRFTFYTTSSSKKSVFDTYAKHDANTNQTAYLNLPRIAHLETVYYLEPVFVPRPGGQGDEDDGWLVGSHFSSKGSLVSISDAKHMHCVCLIRLKSVNPFVIHSYFENLAA